MNQIVIRFINGSVLGFFVARFIALTLMIVEKAFSIDSSDYINFIGSSRWAGIMLGVVVGT
ncbi:hypothetical protein QQ020_23760 [Fulvivirgaceae bacterium BMA12]|uniref:Uncharacterized protein n=1 Tax=Agaribacillus aureus TaxID=3051825 RepID=A0ABT8LFP8_9BACT|nr:hypothetical protein [Fulvivirgaceae bacterium BMA12]